MVFSLSKHMILLLTKVHYKPPNMCGETTTKEITQKKAKEKEGQFIELKKKTLNVVPSKFKTQS